MKLKKGDIILYEDSLAGKYRYIIQFYKRIDKMNIRGKCLYDNNNEGIGEISDEFDSPEYKDKNWKVKKLTKDELFGELI